MPSTIWDGFCFLFNRHLKIMTITETIANAVCIGKHGPRKALMVAELYA
jgi:hypothetical protein